MDGGQPVDEGQPVDKGEHVDKVEHVDKGEHVDRDGACGRVRCKERGASPRPYLRRARRASFF